MVDRFYRDKSDVNFFQGKTRSNSCMRRVVLVTSGAWATRANHDRLNIDIAKQQESSPGEESTTPRVSVEAIVGIGKVKTDSASGIDSSVDIGGATEQGAIMQGRKCANEDGAIKLSQFAEVNGPLKGGT